MDQLTINLGAHGGFNDRVRHTARYAGRFAQFDPASRLDIALDDAVEDDGRHHDRPLDSAVRADPERGRPGTLGGHIAVDVAVEVHTARKGDIAVDPGIGPDQRVDFLVLTRFQLEHRAQFLR